MQSNFRPVLSPTTAEVKTITGTAGTAEVTNTVNFYGQSCRPQLPGGPMPVIHAFVEAFHVADVDGDGKLDAIAGYFQTLRALVSPGEMNPFTGRGDLVLALHLLAERREIAVPVDKPWLDYGCLLDGL